MPLIPKDIAEKRDMALAWSVYELSKIVGDLIRLAPQPQRTEDYKKLMTHLQTLSKMDDRLHTYFLGD
jgi:hypothetical protein